MFGPSAVPTTLSCGPKHRKSKQRIVGNTAARTSQRPPSSHAMAVLRSPNAIKQCEEDSILCVLFRATQTKNKGDPETVESELARQPTTTRNRNISSNSENGLVQ